MHVVANITLRVAGEKWHDVRMDLVHDGTVTGMARVVRHPGSPNDQTATIVGGRIQLLGDFRIVLYYTPDDDPVNGQPNDANPAWVTLFPNWVEVRLHHTFNVQHDDTWVWTIDDFSAHLVGQRITFNATARDVGSDDLTFEWDWGNGTPATATTYFNDGIGPDPYPSPGGTIPFTATDVTTHAFSFRGTFAVLLTVADDDGGSVTQSFDITIG